MVNRVEIQDIKLLIDIPLDSMFSDRTALIEQNNIRVDLTSHRFFE